MIPRIVENTLIAGGISIFSFDVVMIVRQLINIASIDPLTQVYNKRFLLKALSVEIERSRRHCLPLSVMFIGVTDIVARYDGDNDTWQKELNIPAGYKSLYAISLGYKSSDNLQAPSRKGNNVNYIK